MNVTDFDTQAVPASAFQGLSPHAADPDKVPVTAGLPYPPLAVVEQNPHYARILMEDTGGPQGELTATCQYLYDDWCLEPDHAHIADTLKRIAEVEMHHLDLLSRLILMLGGDPRYQLFDGETPVPWTSGMILYSTDPTHILRYNIYLEECAVKAYRSQAARIEDPNVSAMLLRIALDEQVHAGVLKELLRRGR